MTILFDRDYRGLNGYCWIPALVSREDPFRGKLKYQSTKSFVERLYGFNDTVPQDLK